MDMDTAAFIVGLILAIPLWRLYHKIFTVFYFNNAFYGIIGEIFGAFFTGYIIAKFAFFMIGGIAAAIWVILEPILRVALFVAAIYLFSMFIWAFKHRGRSNSEYEYEGIAQSFCKTWNFLINKGPTVTILAFFIMLLGFLGVFRLP